MKTNWEAKTLGAVCDFEGGSQPPKTLFSKIKKENYVRLIQIRDYKSDNHIVYIPQDNAKRFCIENDIMIGRYGPPVFQILSGLNGAYNVALMKAIPKENIILRNYLFLFLKYSKIQDYIIRLSQRAAGQTGVNKAALEAYSIIIPPLSEQQRIVDILNEALEGFTSAIANAEQNRKNARELFDSYLQSVFTQRGDGWMEKRVDEIARNSLGKMLDKAKNRGDFKQYLRNLNVRWFDFDLSDLIEMRFLPEETGQYTALRGDVLICEGGYPGRAAIWDKDYPIYFQKAIHRVRFNNSGHNKWFLYYLYSQHACGNLQKHFTGTGIQHFTGAALSRFTVPIAPSHKIKAIVDRLDSLSAETQRLESLYQQKITALDELKQSLLQRAFAGEL